MGFRLVPTLVTLNGGIAFIFRYFTEFNIFGGGWLKMNSTLQGRVMYAEYHLSGSAETDSPCSMVSLRQLSYLYHAVMA